jgi:hypothetical protein
LKRKLELMRSRDKHSLMRASTMDKRAVINKIQTMERSHRLMFTLGRYFIKVS